MSGNTSQIFSRVGAMGWCVVTAANTAMDGTGTLDAAGTVTSTTGHSGTLFVADATNGGRVERVRVMALGSNVASVARIFINNGSTNATVSNNALWGEITLPATTASNSASVNSTILEIPNTTIDLTGFPLVLPPGYVLMFALGTAVATGWVAIATGGKY